MIQRRKMSHCGIHLKKDEKKNDDTKTNETSERSIVKIIADIPKGAKERKQIV